MSLSICVYVPFTRRDTTSRRAAAAETREAMSVQKSVFYSVAFELLRVSK